MTDFQTFSMADDSTVVGNEVLLPPAEHFIAPIHMTKPLDVPSRGSLPPIDVSVGDHFEMEFQYLGKKSLRCIVVATAPDRAVDYGLPEGGMIITSSDLDLCNPVQIYSVNQLTELVHLGFAKKTEGTTRTPYFSNTVNVNMLDLVTGEATFGIHGLIDRIEEIEDSKIELSEISLKIAEMIFPLLGEELLDDFVRYWKTVHNGGAYAYDPEGGYVERPSFNYIEGVLFRAIKDSGFPDPIYGSRSHAEPVKFFKQLTRVLQKLGQSMKDQVARNEHMADLQRAFIYKSTSMKSAASHYTVSNFKRCNGNPTSFTESVLSDPGVQLLFPGYLSTLKPLMELFARDLVHRKVVTSAEDYGDIDGIITDIMVRTLPNVSDGLFLDLEITTRTGEIVETELLLKVNLTQNLNTRSVIFPADVDPLEGLMIYDEETFEYSPSEKLSSHIFTLFLRETGVELRKLQGTNQTGPWVPLSHAVFFGC